MPSLQDIQGKLCFCITDKFNYIGYIVHVSDTMSIVLKDARVISVDPEKPYTPEDVIKAAANLEAFKAFCANMSTPVEYIALDHCTHIFTTNRDIYNYYNAATKVDKSVIKEYNQPASPSVDLPGTPQQIPKQVTTNPNYLGQPPVYVEPWLNPQRSI